MYFLPYQPVKESLLFKNLFLSFLIVFFSFEKDCFYFDSDLGDFALFRNGLDVINGSSIPLGGGAIIANQINYGGSGLMPRSEFPSNSIYGRT